MKRLANAELRVLHIRRQGLRDFIDNLPKNMSGCQALPYVAQFNHVRLQVRKIVDDPQFDELVNIAEPPDRAPGRYDPRLIRMRANELLCFVDATLADYEYGIARVRALERVQGVRGNVFIAHGSNEVVRHRVKDFIRERCDMNPIILKELASEGMTLIEMLEKYGRTADYAILILTGDDITAEGTARPRQNVIQELGWFQGALGRNRTAMLRQRGIETFSNIGGIAYLSFTGNEVESTFEKLRKELEAAGLM
jgi:hypothetical protein